MCLLELIKQRNKRELIYRELIHDYQQVVNENKILNQKVKILEDKIKKSYECTGFNIERDIDIKKNYF